MSLLMKILSLCDWKYPWCLFRLPRLSANLLMSGCQNTVNLLSALCIYPDYSRWWMEDTRKTQRLSLSPMLMYLMLDRQDSSERMLGWIWWQSMVCLAEAEAEAVACSTVSRLLMKKSRKGPSCNFWYCGLELAVACYDLNFLNRPTSFSASAHTFSSIKFTIYRL